MLLFFDELRARGFIEGKNLTIDYRDFAQHGDLISEYAEELVKAQPDVLYVGGGAAIRAAQKATKTIPILGVTDDMVGEGLVDSLTRPNGNTTGVSILANELDGKRQEILIEAVPGLRRMAALADSSTTTDAKIRDLQEGARAHNIELSIYRIAKGGNEIAAAIDMAQSWGATAFNVWASPMLAALLLTDRASVRFQSLLPGWTSSFSAASRRPTSRSNSRPSSSWCSTSRLPMRWALRCLRHD